MLDTYLFIHYAINMSECYLRKTLLAAILVWLANKAQAGCPFQNPFWFVEKPVVVSVFDENGEMIPNKVRVMWGRMENFKCVDYFQVSKAQ